MTVHRDMRELSCRVQRARLTSSVSLRRSTRMLVLAAGGLFASALVGSASQFAFGQPLKAQAAHTSAISDLAVSQDGSVIASISRRGALVVTELQDGVATRSIKLLPTSAVVCGFADKCTLNVAIRQTAADVTSYNIDVITYQRIDGRYREANRRRLPYVTRGPIAMSEDGRILVTIDSCASAPNRRALAVYDIVAGRPKTTVILDHRARPTALAVSTSGKHVVVGFSDGLCSTVALAGKSSIEYYSGCRTEVTGVAIAGDSSWIGATTGSSAIVWDMQSHNARVVADMRRDSAISLLPDYITSIQSLANGSLGCYTTKAGRVTLFRVDGSTTDLLRDPAGVSATTMVSKTIVAIGTPSGGVLLRDTARAKRISLLGPACGIPNDIGLPSNGGGKVAIAFSSNATVLWDRNSNRTTVLFGEADRVLATCFSRDGRRLWTSHGLVAPQELRLWDVNSGDLLDSFVLSPNPMCYGNTMAVADRGHLLLVGDSLFRIHGTFERKWTYADGEPGLFPFIEFSALLPDDRGAVFCGQRGIPASSRLFVAVCCVETGEIMSKLELTLPSEVARKRRAWALHSNGRRLLGIAGEEWFVVNLDQFRVSRRGTCSSFRPGVSCVSFGRTMQSDTAWIACGLGDGQILMGELSDDVLSQRVVTGDAAVRCLRVEADGQRVVFGTASGQVGVLDVRAERIQWMPSIDASVGVGKKQRVPEKKRNR